MRLVRAKVELGEADAAIVYRTDAISSDRVHLVPVPEEINVQTDCIIGEAARAPQNDLARKWIDAIRSKKGRKLLIRYGFSVPQ